MINAEPGFAVVGDVGDIDDACMTLAETRPAYADEERVIQAAELGVHAYLLKGCPNESLVEAIRNVYRY